MNNYLKPQTGITCCLPIYQKNGQIFIDSDFYKYLDDILNIKLDLGIVCRKNYKQKYNNDLTDYTMFELAYLIATDDKPNCEIVEEENYSRSEPNKTWYCYILYPLRDLKKGQKITVKKDSFPLNVISKNINPLRSQPDYGQRDIEQQSKYIRQKISNELYHDCMIMSNIVYSLCDSLIKGK